MLNLGANIIYFLFQKKYLFKSEIPGEMYFVNGQMAFRFKISIKDFCLRYCGCALSERALFYPHYYRADFRHFILPRRQKNEQ